MTKEGEKEKRKPKGKGENKEKPSNDCVTSVIKKIINSWVMYATYPKGINPM